jgi:manganese/zinc/iron transport system ATP- binding protein
MGRYTERGLFKRFTKEDHQRVESAIERVGLSAYSKRQISQLSGGQQQRVFLARSIAQEADLYLMDEPFAGVDASTESAIVDLLKEMKSQGKTVLVVHHDLHTADEYFDHLVMLNTKLVKSGPLEDVFNLDTLKDTYGGSMTILSKLTEVMKEKEHPIRHS